jgi:hypothetical protein
MGHFCTVELSHALFNFFCVGVCWSNIQRAIWQTIDRRLAVMGGDDMDDPAVAEEKVLALPALPTRPIWRL